MKQYELYSDKHFKFGSQMVKFQRSSTVQSIVGYGILLQGRAQGGGPVARATAPLPSSTEVPLSPPSSVCYR